MARIPERIFLVGPMGAGKSTIGKALALVLEKPFLDLDEEIVRQSAMSIPEIFEKESEKGFRRREHEALVSVLRYSAVIATGGGVVVTPENLEVMKKSGFVCYLIADVETQYLRTSRDNNRPMLATDDRKKRLSDIFCVRDPLYRSVCNAIIDSGRNSVHECVEQLKKILAPET